MEEYEKSITGKKYLTRLKNIVLFKMGTNTKYGQGIT